MMARAGAGGRMASRRPCGRRSPEEMLGFAYAVASDVGLVRDGNEDAGFAAPYLQLVADGVGGSAAGEVASATTAYVVSALAAAEPVRDPVELLRQAVLDAHLQLQDGV